MAGERPDTLDVAFSGELWGGDTLDVAYFWEFWGKNTLDLACRAKTACSGGSGVGVVPCLLFVPALDGGGNDALGFVGVGELLDLGGARILEILVVVEVELNLLQQLLGEVG